MTREQRQQFIEAFHAMNAEITKGEQLEGPPDWLTGDRERHLFFTYQIKAHLIQMNAEQLATMCRLIVAAEFARYDRKECETWNDRQGMKQAEDQLRNILKELGKYEYLLRGIDPLAVPKDLRKYLDDDDNI